MEQRFFLYSGVFCLERNFKKLGKRSASGGFAIMRWIDLRTEGCPQNVGRQIYPPLQELFAEIWNKTNIFICIKEEKNRELSTGEKVFYINYLRKNLELNCDLDLGRWGENHSWRDELWVIPRTFRLLIHFLTYKCDSNLVHMWIEPWT